MARIGWRALGACIVVIVVYLIVWSTLSSRGVQNGKRWRTFNYVSFTVENKETLADDATLLTSLSHGSAERADTNHQGPVTGSSSSSSAADAEEEGTMDLPLLEKKKEGDVESVPFYLYTFSTLMTSEAETCSQCEDADCKADCKRHGQYQRYLNASSELDPSKARLFVVSVDALAWLRKTDGGGSKYQEMLTAFVTRLQKEHDYLTFKGSDHVLLCMAEECSELGSDLAEALSGTAGTRAIFAGVDVDGNDMRWPCPLRVISLDRSVKDESAAAMAAILQSAGRMIKQKNRWICFNAEHPVNHWNSSTNKKSLGGIYMFEYGFQICAIPKSGSTMTKVLMRRMMHYKNWNQTGTGINQNPKRSGLVFNSKLTAKQKKATHSINFVKAAIVRNPITRLLSGYSDKIFQKHQYRRVPGLRKCMKGRPMPPNFHDFVQCLMTTHRDPNHLDQHFRMQSSFCNLRHAVPDFLGKQDDLFEEFKEFAESLSFWDKYGANGWGAYGKHAFGEQSYQHRTHNSSNHIWEYYTEDLMRQVYEYYKEDFDRFGFSLEEMLATKPDKSNSATALPSLSVQSTGQ